MFTIVEAVILYKNKHHTNNKKQHLTEVAQEKVTFDSFNNFHLLIYPVICSS